METPTISNHIGRKIARVRELKGIKQEALAAELGTSQQSISHIEQSETIDDDKLERIAEALGVTKEGIKNFSEERVMNFFNTFHDHSFSHSQGTFSASHCTFNPLEKIIELYERLVEAEKEKVQYLEELLKRK